METVSQHSRLPLFNGAIEMGLRAAVILCDAHPIGYGLQRLVVLDYLLVHSDDLPDGPAGLHPQTPHRGGELLVRRDALERGLNLLESRGLVERRFDPDGVVFAATESTAIFVDALSSDHSVILKERARWLVATLGSRSERELTELATASIGVWGAEFVMESVLHEENPEWR